MESIIKQLQMEALSSESLVSDLLRKAKLVAVKLNLKEFLEWIENELGGYKIKNNDELPAYRIISGETKAWNPYHGWQPIMFTDPKVEQLMSQRGITQAIGEIENLVPKSKDDGMLFMNFSAETKSQIIKAINFETDIKFLIPPNCVEGILEAVRNRILDWSLQLEKEGILGEGFSFSQQEKEKAKEPDVVYKIDRIENFAGSIGPVSSGSSITINQINASSKNEIKELIEQIKKYVPQIELAVDDEQKMGRHITELEQEISLDNPRLSLIKNAFSSIKLILEGVAGNVIAQGIIFGIQKIIG